MNQVSYGLTTKVRGASFEHVLDATTAALKEQGFGVLTEIDVRATLKKKLDQDFRNYRILGACNPKLAHQALSQELYIGLLLPCNVVVFEEDDGVVVSAVNPEEMFKIVEREDLAWIAGEVRGRLEGVIKDVEKNAGGQG